MKRLEAVAGTIVVGAVVATTVVLALSLLGPNPSTSTSVGPPVDSPPPTPSAQSPATLKPTPSPTPTLGSVEEVTVEVGPGDTATTDAEGDGATPDDPVETSLFHWAWSGTVSIAEGSVQETPPTGFEFLGLQVTISAPDSTADDPLIVLFRLDASLIPDGDDEPIIQILKNGALVPACEGGPGTADPDPCVFRRLLMNDGDQEITVFTSTASTARHSRIRTDRHSSVSIRR